MPATTSPPILPIYLSANAQKTPTMSDTTAKPAAQPAKIAALQLQLLDLATRSKPVPVDRRQQGPVLVIRGK